MKKFFGAAAFTVLVTLKFPPVNVLVEMEVQFDNANVTFVLVNTILTGAKVRRAVDPVHTNVVRYC